ncbi:MAG TPA: hypothetical protein VNW71_03855 [Thermoanaerobaculia bacterium]|nr:hypothetical protein [Thermoanaerobaculia bacterium]
MSAPTKKVSRLLLSVAVPILLAHGVSAQENCPETTGLQDYINCRLGAEDLSEEEAAAEELAAAGQEDADKVANADSLGGSKLDLAKRFFTLLNLGDLKEEPTGITFSFNPELFPDLPLHFNPRVVVHEPELYETLVTEIDREGGPIAEGMRADLKDRLKKSFGDFDDTELRVVGSWRHLSRTEGAAVMAESIFEASGFETTSFNFLAEKLPTWMAVNPDLQAMTPLNTLEDGLRAQVKSDIDSFADQAAREVEALHQSLENNRFYALGMLVANDPQVSFDGFYRLREGAAGPNEWGGTARYEYGLVSYAQYLRWAGRAGRGGKSVETLNTYLARPSVQHWFKRQPRVAALLEVSRIDPFTLDRPEDGLSMKLDSIRRLTGKLTYGQVLASNPGSKFDFEARYDDFSDDLTKKNRFVATATWTQKLTDRLAQAAGGTQLVVSAIWANKPEFRGEVDRGFGMRAGLKWALDGDEQENDQGENGE